MKAAVFQHAMQPLVIQSVPDPVPQAGEVLLRVRACGICGSDLHATTIDYPQPIVLGHEFTGEIVNANGTRFASGTRATAIPVHACGHCRACQDGYPMACSRNQNTGFWAQYPGAYSELVAVPEGYLVPLPEGVSDEEGALVEPLAVGLHAVDRAEIEIGARVLIIGSGPIGLAVTTFARLAGASTVIVSEKSATRRDAARAFGATASIDPTPDTPLAEQFCALAGAAPDVVFDCVGLRGTLQASMNAVRQRGTVVVVGVCMEQDAISHLAAVTKELTIRYALGYHVRDFDRVLALITARKLDPTPMISQHITLDELPRTFDGLRHSARQIKVMVNP